MRDKPSSRRAWLGRAAASAAAWLIVPRHVLGGPGHRPPSETLTRATLGTGAQGLTHVLPNRPDAPPVQRAVCDVDRRHLARALEKAGPGCEGYADFRRVLDRRDVDLVIVAAPTHWHAVMTVAAVQAGKDVLCEKPLTRHLAEGRDVAAAAERYGRTVLCHTFGRRPWRRLRALVAAGLLGTPLRVHVGPRTGFGFKVRDWLGRPGLPPCPVPADLDYDLWLGPAPWKPYHPHRSHRTWRGYWDYEAGGLGDMGPHWTDAVQYILGKDDTAPVEVEAAAPWPQDPEACGLWGHVRLAYADGTAVTLESGEWGEAGPGRPALLEGPLGKVFRDASGRLAAEPADLLDRLAALPDPPDLVDWEEAVRTRTPAPTHLPRSAEARRGAALVHLGALAVRLGRKLRYDPAGERFIGDEEADRLSSPPPRAPWQLG